MEHPHAMNPTPAARECADRILQYAQSIMGGRNSAEDIAEQISGHVQIALNTHDAQAKEENARLREVICEANDYISDCLLSHEEAGLKVDFQLGQTIHRKIKKLLSQQPNQTGG
jgi:hypothetical protein